MDLNNNLSGASLSIAGTHDPVDTTCAQGVAKVKLPAGRIAEVSRLSGSGHDALDQGVLSWLHQLGSFAPFPEGLKRERWELEIPVIFKLR